MLYEKLKNLSADNFKRYCGVERKTFDKMCAVVRQKSSAQRLASGRPSKLLTKDRVLRAFGVLARISDDVPSGDQLGNQRIIGARTITRVEDILTDSKEFVLPARGDEDFSPDLELVVVDVVETEPERPKKNRSVSFRARKSGTR